MKLSKDGISITVVKPSEIARYKEWGYKEVVEEPKVVEEAEEDKKPKK